MTSNLGFVPLMVRPCEIPLSICRIQWLDVSDCLLLDAPPQNSNNINDNHNDNNNHHHHCRFSVNAAIYPSRFKQLVAALKAGTLDHNGQHVRFFSLFAPFSFQTQVYIYIKINVVCGVCVSAQLISDARVV
jgi:hypothetical protein